MEPPRDESSEQEQNIAKKRDALLADARGEKGIGSSGGRMDPRMMGLGLQFVVAILLALYIGMWLDAKFHTAPWLMLIGALIGASAGFYSMFRVVMSEDKRMDEEDRKK
jgi:F0F1-type ATP synthase assembly protein I